MRLKPLLISGLLLLATLTVNAQQSVDELYELLNKLKSAGKFEDAAIVENQIARHHSRAYLRFLTASSESHEAGEFSATIENIRSAMGIEGTYPLLVGEERFMMRRDSLLNVSLENISEIQESFPTADVFIMKSDVLCALQRYDEAVTAYKEAISLRPEDIELHLGLGYLYIKLKNWEEVVHENSIVLEVDSNSSIGYANRGFGYLHLEEYELAIADYEASIRLGKEAMNQGFAMNNIGYAYLKLGNLPLARASIESSIRINSLNSFAWRNMALLCIAEEDQEGACEAIAEAIELGFVKYYGNEILELKAEHCESNEK